MGKILYLEDAGYLRNQTVKFLTEDGFEVHDVGRIDQAMEYVEEHSNEIDCIITDLNMNDEWLGQYRNESNGCLFAGWVWLNRYVLSNEKTKNIPCIIYSGYIQELEDYFIYNRQKSLRARKIAVVRKGGNDDNGYDALLKELKRMMH